MGIRSVIAATARAGAGWEQMGAMVRSLHRERVLDNEQVLDNQALVKYQSSGSKSNYICFYSAYG